MIGVTAQSGRSPPLPQHILCTQLCSLFLLLTLSNSRTLTHRQALLDARKLLELSLRMCWTKRVRFTLRMGVGRGCATEHEYHRAKEALNSTIPALRMCGSDVINGVVCSAREALRLALF